MANLRKTLREQREAKRAAMATDAERDEEEEAHQVGVKKRAQTKQREADGTIERRVRRKTDEGPGERAEGIFEAVPRVGSQPHAGECSMAYRLLTTENFTNERI